MQPEKVNSTIINQMRNVVNAGLEPKYVSLNKNGYEAFLKYLSNWLNINIAEIPNPTFYDMKIIYNSNQAEPILVLADCHDQYIYELQARQE